MSSCNTYTSSLRVTGTVDLDVVLFSSFELPPPPPLRDIEPEETDMSSLGLGSISASAADAFLNEGGIEAVAVLLPSENVPGAAVDLGLICLVSGARAGLESERGKVFVSARRANDKA